MNTQSVRILPYPALVEVFFDGECPLCMREINLLRRLDRDTNHIVFTDISAADFRPEKYNKTMSGFMERIQGRLPEGQWIEGVEVFRQLYSAVGFERFIPITRLPVVRQLLHLGYRIFAKFRLRLTGRSASAQVECENDRCATPEI